jgi:chemotaxis protein methyltransferase CheR
MEHSNKNREYLELELLLEAIFQFYGYDFRMYRKAHLKRRVENRMILSGISHIPELIHKMLYDENLFKQILLDFSINVTEMFRDPEFYKFIRQSVIPRLRTYPYLKVWHAGCSTGEEVYSMIILFKEEGLLSRTQFYATDFNTLIIQQASEGVFKADKLKEYAENYILSGGKESLTEYFNIAYDRALIDKSLKKNVVFADHNLVMDGVFGEMNMILCRNVLIYFNRKLQLKVLKLFSESMVPGGYLCLGTKESLNPMENNKIFTEMEPCLKIYKKAF